MSDAEHPGLGEEGKYHSKKDEHPLPEGTTLTYALVGNQNCGKTTLFNKLTGSNQHVGNFPGVTVDLKQVLLRDTQIQRLPTFREFILCHLTAVRKSFPEILFWMRNQVRSSILLMRQT